MRKSTVFYGVFLDTQALHDVLENFKRVSDDKKVGYHTLDVQGQHETWTYDQIGQLFTRIGLWTFTPAACKRVEGQNYRCVAQLSRSGEFWLLFHNLPFPNQRRLVLFEINLIPWAVVIVVHGFDSGFHDFAAVHVYADFVADFVGHGIGLLWHDEIVLAE
jgi:hypothetical protein